MRTLIYIPIIHAQANTGALGGAVRSTAIEKLGYRGWGHRLPANDRLWVVIRETIEKMNLPHQRVRLYQDGLPQCGREVQIVMDLAQAGSPNHQLLLFLIQKGGILVGTESPDLLLEEYQLVRRVLDARSRAEAEQVEARQRSLSHSLLGRRDRYIAQRINETLFPGETGILFLDTLHSIQDHLAEDIEVTYPFN